MLHRHLNHSQYTLAAIDDVIARGGRTDWAELRNACRADTELLSAIQKVCAARRADPTAARHQLWYRYVEHRRSA
jgi:hypothetical protein